MVKIPSLKEAKNNINTFCKRVLFLSSKKPVAGMALEGSLALPIFLFFHHKPFLSSLRSFSFQMFPYSSPTVRNRRLPKHKPAFLSGSVKCSC